MLRRQSEPSQYLVCRTEGSIPTAFALKSLPLAHAKRYTEVGRRTALTLTQQQDLYGSFPPFCSCPFSLDLFVDLIAYHLSFQLGLLPDNPLRGCLVERRHGRQRQRVLLESTRHCGWMRRRREGTAENVRKRPKRARRMGTDAEESEVLSASRGLWVREFMRKGRMASSC